MGYKYTGDAVLGVSLTVESPKPLDSRLVVSNLDELYNIPEKYAYQGMAVANIDNGNIYMLVDKSKIHEKAGWKASYESILIITCTESEYKEWQANTTDDYKPIDENKTYLHAETYYYIYEGSMDDDLFYLSAAWGKEIEESLKNKAANSTVVDLRKDLDNTMRDYAKTENVANTYAPKTDFDLNNPESFLSSTLSNYYTSELTDTKFVTKDDLRGEGMEGEDDFVFVTQFLYGEDNLKREEEHSKIWEELDKTVKTDGNGSLESITVGQIKSLPVEGKEQLVIDVKEDGLYNNTEKFAVLSDIPNLVTIKEEEYLKLVEEGTIQEDTYYYVYDTTNDARVYITKEYLDLNYHTINLYRSWVSTNYYNKEAIDNIVSGLQVKGDYVLSETLKEYYNKVTIDELFITKTNASTTYATLLSLSEYKDYVGKTYVTIASLGGEGDLEEGDFIFVKQSTYLEDEKAKSEEFTSKKLNSETNQTNLLIIGTENSQNTVTSTNNRLQSEGKDLAYIEEIPKMECISTAEFEEKTEAGSIEEDTYYFTYEEDLAISYAKKSDLKGFYTKEEVNALLLNLRNELTNLINLTE